MGLLWLHGRARCRVEFKPKPALLPTPFHFHCTHPVNQSISHETSPIRLPPSPSSLQHPVFAVLHVLLLPLSLSLSLSLCLLLRFSPTRSGERFCGLTHDVISLWQFDWIGLWVCDRVWEPLRSILPFPFVFLGCSRRILKIGFLIWRYGLFSLFRFEGRGEAESRKGKRWW